MFLVFGQNSNLQPQFSKVFNTKCYENLFHGPWSSLRADRMTDRQTDTHKTRIRPPLFKVFFFGERGETSVTDIILD